MHTIECIPLGANSIICLEGKGGSMSHEVNIDLSEYGGPKLQIKGLRWIVVGIFGILFLFTFFYSVGTEEVGVIQRFGAYTRTVPSGLHIKMPFGIESVRKVPVERQLKEEFGFRTKAP